MLTDNSFSYQSPEKQKKDAVRLLLIEIGVLLIILFFIIALLIYYRIILLDKIVHFLGGETTSNTITTTGVAPTQAKGVTHYCSKQSTYFYAQAKKEELVREKS